LFKSPHNSHFIAASTDPAHCELLPRAVYFLSTVMKSKVACSCQRRSLYESSSQN